MDSLLRHMVDMTGHRDHTMLDISVMSAVQELSGATPDPRAGALPACGGQQFVRSRASSRPAASPAWKSRNDSGPGEPIATYPGTGRLPRASHATRAEAIGADGLRTPVAADLVRRPGRYLPRNRSRQRRSRRNTIHVIGGIVSVYRNFQNLLDYSERDSLTGLLNRKTFDDQLAQACCMPRTSNRTRCRARPSGARTTGAEQQWLAVVDVDHFKTVNDHFGHLYGDEVLILIANLLQSSFRTQDRVFRFGGEEFVVLLRSTTLDNAQQNHRPLPLNVESARLPASGASHRQRRLCQHQRGSIRR